MAARHCTERSERRRGFALLIAVIFMSVMLTLGLMLGSLMFKQQQLTSTALRSQNAFYAADAALECALYADQKQDVFNYVTHAQNPGNTVSVSCEGTPTPFTATGGIGGSVLEFQGRISVDSGAECADITVYKPDPTSVNPITYVFSQGYNVSCTDVAGATNSSNFVSQGLEAYY